MPTQDSLEAAKKAANASETPSPAIAKAKANKAPKKPRKAGKAAPKVSKGKAKAKAAQVAKAAPSANKAAPGFMVRASDIIVVRKRNALGPRAKCFRGKAQTVAANKAAQTKAKAAQVAKAAPSANKAAPGFMVRASDIIVVRKRNALGPRAKCFRGKAQTVAANKAAQTKAGFGTRSKYLRRLVIEGAITLRAGK